MEPFIISESTTTVDMKKIYQHINKTNFSDTIKEDIKGMFEVISSGGDNDINLDFADIEVILNHGGVAFVGSGEHEGENSATEAIKLAIKGSTLNFSLINKISGIWIHLEMHPAFPLMDIAEAMEILHENAHYKADIICGTTTDESLSENYVKATILFTGFEKNSYKDMSANNTEYKQ